MIYKMYFGEQIPHDKKTIDEWIRYFNFKLYNSSFKADDKKIDICEFSYLVGCDCLIIGTPILPDSKTDLYDDIQYNETLLDKLYSCIILNATNDEKEKLKQGYIITSFIKDLLNGRDV